MYTIVFVFPTEYSNSYFTESHVYDQVDAEGFVDDLWKIIQDHKLAIGGKPDQKVLEFTQPQDLQVRQNQFK